MDIYSPPGSLVVFAHPDAGFQTNKHSLKEGCIYTVEKINVHSWYTDVYLVEVPGVAFNSVLFDNYEEIEEGI